MRVFHWVLRAFIFFTLFAFALNNEQPVVVHWFFGTQWSAPLVIVVLAAFVGGLATGVLAMLPGWWRQRSVARRHAPPPAPARKTDEAAAAVSEPVPQHPPREGL